MLRQRGGNAALRALPVYGKVRCYLSCRGLKTRQAPSHAGWRIFVVYIFSRKHDLNRKKLDLGTRHPRPTFAPSPRREVRPRRAIKRALKPRLQCSQRAMWSLKLLPYPAARARYNASTRVYDGARFNPPLRPA